MNQTATLLVCAVLAAASSLATCDFKYLDFSLLQKPGWDQNIENTRQALELIGTIEGKDEEDRFSRIKSRIEKLSKAPKVSNSHLFVFNHLLNFLECTVKPTEQFTKRVMEICYILSDQEYKNLDYFASFFRHYGRAKFGHHIQMSIDELLKDGSYTNAEAKADLDALFNVDMLDDIGKLRGLMKVEMRQFGTIRTMQMLVGFEDEREEVLKNFFNKILELCGKLRENREFHFNVITLAETFGVIVEKMPAKVGVLKEYNRLCASVALKETQVAIGEYNKYYEFPILRRTNKA